MNVTLLTCTRTGFYMPMGLAGVARIREGTGCLMMIVDFMFVSVSYLGNNNCRIKLEFSFFVS